MSFKIETTTMTLILDDYDGAEVVCKSNVSLGDMLHLRDLGSTEEGLKDAYTNFAESVLISWNIEDESGAVPANAKGLMKLPTAMAAQILSTWGEQIANPKVTSSIASSGGNT